MAENTDPGVVYMPDFSDSDIELGIEVGLFRDTGDGTVILTDSGRSFLHALQPLQQNSPSFQQTTIEAVQPTS